jgi:hypothetical protein
MQIANKVKIAGQVMKIVLDPHLASGEDRFGACNSMKGEIIIDSMQPIEHQESSLLHEIIEKINSDNELGLEHNQITLLGTQFHQVIKDNPEIFK